MTRVLTTTESVATNLATVDGNAYPVAPAGSGGTPGVLPPLYSVVLRPGDTSGADNVFTTWAALYASCAPIAGGVRVVVDDSIAACHMTAGGPYVLNSWRFEGVANFNNIRGTSALIIDDGVTWDGTKNTTVDFWLLDVTCNATADVTIVYDGVEWNLSLRGSRMACLGSGRLLNIATSGPNGGGFSEVNLYDFCEIGDGVHLVIEAGPAPGFCTITGETGSHVRVGCLSAGIISTDASCEQDNVASAALTIILQDEAQRVAYTPAILANWNGAAPTSVANALDRIAAKIGPIP